MTDASAPPLRLYLSEPARAVREYGAFRAAQPLLRSLPHGDGDPVLVLPGLLADDGSTRALRQVLRGLGYRVHGWRLGRNIGPTADIMSGMPERLDSLHQRYGRPVSLIGWSLGGILARDLARKAPDKVRQVITLGSPFRIASPRQSRAHRNYERYAHLHVEPATFPRATEVGPLPVPTTSIYSRYDGIVAWQACLNLPYPQAENIAVKASHCGMGHHPAVLWAVADRLAQPADTWRPFRAPAALAGLFPPPDAVPAGPPQQRTASTPRRRLVVSVRV